MDQKKIGKFISKLRKNKNMTQEQLAEKMCVSINAVSKWERGLNFPDISLCKKLCTELSISLEELINGEKDNSDEAKEKALISTINEKNHVKKKSNKIIGLLIILFTIVIVIVHFYNNNLKINLVSGFDTLYDNVIVYLRNEEFKNNRDSKMKDFNVFYSYYGFGIEEKDNYNYVYMWIQNQSYYLEEENVLAISSGSSVPCKATFKNNKIIKIEYPKDGSEYVTSIKKIFPKIIATQILNFNKEENLNKLFNDVQKKKSKYYNYLNLDMNKIKLDDINYGELLFTINKGNKTCIPVNLSIYKNNKYILSTAYEACKKGQVCTSILKFTKSVEGTYNYDIIQIIKHSTDASNIQFNSENFPQYEIFTGNGYHFITDDDNKHLIEFLKSINVDLNKCAEPDYVD